MGMGGLIPIYQEGDSETASDLSTSHSLTGQGADFPTSLPRGQNLATLIPCWLK